MKNLPKEANGLAKLKGKKIKSEKVVCILSPRRFEFSEPVKTLLEKWHSGIIRGEGEEWDRP